VSRVVYSPQARRDLFDIGAYIELDSPANAARFVAKLEDKIRRIALAPRIYTRRDDLLAGLRSAAFGSYLILFRMLDDGIEVVHVVHGARDLPRLFEK